MLAHTKLPLLLFVLVGLSLPSVAKTNTKCLPLNKDEANIAICTKLADKGDANAQNSLGEIYYQDALLHKGYHTKARLLFEKAAAQGLAKAQYNLGAIYRDEFNNFPVALSWFEKAAAQGNLDAQNSIGYIYENGSGGKPPRNYFFDENGKNTDPDLPYIEAKFAPYEFQLPSDPYSRAIYPMSEFGQGVEPDLAKAIEWYQKAANKGHALAQTNLAYFYLFGIGVEKDEKKAFELYQKAAKQNCAPALKTLAFMYMQGLGTEQDVPKSFATLEQAYQILPDDNLWHMISHKMYIRYSLKTTLKYYKEPRRQKFQITDSSDEDYITEKFQFFNRIYQLNLINGIGPIEIWPRPTWSVILGETVGEITPLKERYLVKKSIQGYYKTMTYLSYYYKGEAQDITQAQLWRKYAITMGELPFENYWPGYPPLEE
jgi:TPR repeat protein